MVVVKRGRRLAERCGSTRPIRVLATACAGTARLLAEVTALYAELARHWAELSGCEAHLLDGNDDFAPPFRTAMDRPAGADQRQLAGDVASLRVGIGGAAPHYGPTQLPCKQAPPSQAAPELGECLHLPLTPSQ